MQREMPWFSEVEEPEFLTESEIHNCNSFGQAVALCINRSRLTNETIAERIGISAGTLSKIVKGSAGIKRRQMELLEMACGNRAVTQYMAKNAGCHLVRTTTDEKIKELEEQLAKLRAA